MLAIQSFKYHPEYYRLEESIEKQVCVFLSAHGRDFSCFLNIVRDSAVLIGLERSLHQPGTVNENVLESDLVVSL